VYKLFDIKDVGLYYTGFYTVFHIMQKKVIFAITASDKLDKRSNEALCLAHLRKNKIFHMIFIYFPILNFIKICEIFSEYTSK